MTDKEIIEQMTKFIRQCEQDIRFAYFHNYLMKNTDTFDPFYISEDVQLTDMDIVEMFKEFTKNNN